MKNTFDFESGSAFFVLKENCVLSDILIGDFVHGECVMCPFNADIVPITNGDHISILRPFGLGIRLRDLALENSCTLFRYFQVFERCQELYWLFCI